MLPLLYNFAYTILHNFYIFSLEGGYSQELWHQARTIEAKLALLLRISHKYGTSGAQVLFSMDILQHCASCRAMDIFVGIRYVLVHATLFFFLMVNHLIHAN